MEATDSPRPVQGAAPHSWLVGFCLARGLFSMSQTSYAAALPLLKQDWQMTGEQSGLISSAYFFGFLFSLFAVGFMADRIGAKRTYLSTSAVAAVSALAFAVFANDFLSAFLLYGLTGLFAGGSYTPALAILAQRYPSRGRGRAIGFYIASASAGYAVSLLLSGWLIALDGWRTAFVVTCAGPTLGMVVGAWALRTTPNVIPQPAGEHPEGNLLRAVITNKPAMLMILAYTAHSWELLGLWSWSTYYLSHVFSGGTATTLGASMGASFTAVAYLISTAGPILSGMASDRLGRTVVIGAMSTVSVICSFTLGWLAMAPFWVVVAVMFVYQFAGIADSPVISTAQTELVSPRYLGAAYSLRSVLGFGAGSLSPWLFGVVLDHVRAAQPGAQVLPFGLAFGLLGLGGMFCPLFIFWLRRQPGARSMAGGMR